MSDLVKDLTWEIHDYCAFGMIEGEPVAQVMRTGDNAWKPVSPKEAAVIGSVPLEQALVAAEIAVKARLEKQNDETHVA